MPRSAAPACDCGAARAPVFLSGNFASFTDKENRMEAKVGSAAPDFALASHTDQKLSLASFRGRCTVVSFLPFAFTGG